MNKETVDKDEHGTCDELDSSASKDDDNGSDSIDFTELDIWASKEDDNSGDSIDFSELDIWAKVPEVTASKASITTVSKMKFLHHSIAQIIIRDT